MTSRIANKILELDESESEEVEEVSTIILQAQVGKSEENIVIQDVDSSVEVLDLDICASSDADPTVELLEKSIDQAVIGESLPVGAKAVEDKITHPRLDLMMP